MKTIITYGTFDLLHVGHVNMLERLAALGDKLIVGVSTDQFNLEKGKHSIYSYAERAKIVEALRCVDQVIAEHDWQQKVKDIEQYQIDIFGIGADWQGKFDQLSSHCEVVYLPRTPSISTTDLKKALSKIDGATIQQIKNGLDSVLDLVKAIE
jgi:glycerol-3-phosphate cytidylyltransferase